MVKCVVPKRQLTHIANGVRRDGKVSLIRPVFACPYQFVIYFSHIAKLNVWIVAVKPHHFTTAARV
jgi:hypothetical protein